MEKHNIMKCVKAIDPAPAKLQYITDEARPLLPEEGAVIKVLYCGMCHSDAHVWSRGGMLPMILGHEVSGIIDSIGSSAANPDGLTVGDQVAVYPWIGCESCKPCNTGYSSYCDQFLKEQIEIGITRPGGYAEYLAIPKLIFLVKVPETVPMEIAGLLGCGMLTAYNAVQTAIPKIDPILRVRDKCGILIIGVGGLGLSAVNLLKSLVLAKHANVELVCADLKESKLSLAKKAGCHGVVHWSTGDSEEEMVNGISSVFTEKGAHIVMDFVGCKQTFTVGLQALKKHGTLVSIGGYGIGTTQNIPTYKSTLCSIGVQYVYTGSLQQMKELTQLVADGKVSPIPWKLYPLKEAVRLMYELDNGRIDGRAILSPV